MSPSQPSAERLLDRALVTLRREFGSEAAVPEWREGQFDAVLYRAVCPLHPVPGLRPLTIRERPGTSLDLSCEERCLPSTILAELRRLEEWRVVQAAADQLRAA